MTVSLSAGPLLRPVNAEKRPSFVEELLRHFAKSPQSPEKLAGPALVLFLVPMRESGIILWVFFFPGQEKSRSYRPAELKQLHTHIHTHSQTHTHPHLGVQTYHSSASHFLQVLHITLSIYPSIKYTLVSDL